MVSQKKSRVVPAKSKKSTLRANRHVFQGFHERTTNLTINPVQRARQQDERTTESYVKARLEFWKDTNLSATFTEFTRIFEPLCNSLVQILHNEQRIFDVLVEYIDKKDVHSLEPLLDLLNQFAHDLGVRFEKFFARSLTTVVALVSGHQAIEVIEWSFNTLAWLFQYLSKLLVPDLRPTYDILAPLLGKQVRKEHIARFAAEALSFLVRKAAAKYQRDPSPLTSIIKHMLEDWSATKEVIKNEDVYGYGLMVLFADAIKGIKSSQAIKENGLDVYKVLLQESLRLCKNDIVVGVTTSLIHHTQAATFSGTLNVALGELQQVNSDASTDALLHSCELLYTITAVRKGTRILDWNAVFKTADHLVMLLSSRAQKGAVFSQIPTLTIASIIQTAAFDALISWLPKSINALTENRSLFDFPHFCLFAWEINADRFHELLKHHMFCYMAKHWDDSDIKLLFSAHTIVKMDSTTARTLSPSTRLHLRDWSGYIAEKLEAANWNQSQVKNTNALLDLAIVMTPALTRQQMAKNLVVLLTKGLEEPLTYSFDERRLFFGGCLSWYLEQQSSQTGEPAFTWNQLLTLQHDHSSMPLYLENLLQFLNSGGTLKQESGSFQEILIRNLSTEASALRLASLHLLNKIHELNSGSEAAGMSTAIAIENTSIDHQSVRVFAMHIGRLGAEYAAQVDHPWLDKAIVHYLFGLLTVRLAPVWTEVINTLKQIYDQGKGDGVQLLEDLAFQWLETRGSEELESHASDGKTYPDGPINNFQCTNARLWRSLFDNWAIDLNHSGRRLAESFDEKHKYVHPVPKESTAQALRVLGAIPVLAERRSRRLVPLFLRWASADEDSEATLLGDVSPNSDKDNRSGLSWKEQKSMLDVFGLFQNPSVLHQSTEVYNALLRLLGNGDVQMQKAALKALCTWKLPGVKRYQEELNNLLDNARFREEMTVFLPSQTTENDVSTAQRRDLMRVLLRLLYGRIIARGAGAAGRTSQTARRKAVFETLATFPTEDLHSFVEIILGPLHSLVLKEDRIVSEDPTTPLHFPVRKQMGLVRLVKDLLDSLGDKLQPLAERLLNAVLYCLDNVKTAQEDSADAALEDEHITSMSSMHKAIRQGALQDLLRLYKACKSLDANSYARVIDTVVLAPRLGPKFVAENAQSVSSTLQLLSVWAERSDTRPLLFGNSRLLPALLDCLDVPSGSSDAKAEVKIFILEQILKPLIGSSDSDTKLRLDNTNFYEKLLENAAKILDKGGAKDLLAAAVSTILEVASSGSNTAEEYKIERWSESVSTELVRVFSALLALPHQVVSPATKTSALTVLSRFLPTLSQDQGSSHLVKQLYTTLSKLFSTAKDPGLRVQLSHAFEATAALRRGRLPLVAQLCSQLNSFSMGRLDEPDYEERERAFETIAQTSDFGDEEWTPLINNALFLIGDQEELVIRKGASRILRRFIENSSAIDRVKNTEKMSPTSKLMRGVLLPALLKAASERSELVRVEYLSVMAHLVKCCPEWTEIKDLTHLATASDDSESFFDGILHIQQDWRIRSLVKLAKVARQGHLGNDIIAHYLLPLVQQFVLDRADDDNAHSLAAQSITTVGALVSSLEWTQARKTLRHYCNIIKDKPELEKAVIRLIGVTTEAIFTAALTDSVSPLKRTIPGATTLVSDIDGTLLPPLVSFLHHKDENVVSLRVPIAVSAARLICLLPEDVLEYKLAPVLTDVCNILRSKAQESRDLSRKTLSEIAALIGPERFSFILKELRIALSRGKQLHVLSYTVHSLLVESNFAPGDLDYCLPEIMRVVLDDTFGATGQEKDAEGYTNKAKEVKGSKSLDTAERMARITTVGHLSQFIMPIHKLLIERLDAQATTKVDELLRRIRSGLEQNESIGTQKTLIFSFEVLQQAKITAVNAKSDPKVLTRKEQQQKDTFEIKTKGARKAPKLPQISSQQYKLARFALDLLREVLRRHEDLRTSSNIAGFIVPVGDILLDAQEEVQISALRLLASIMKVPMKEWAINAPVYADTAYKALRNQPDTNTELSQAALKLLTSLVKDRPEVSLKDSQLSWLIKAIIPDLTQPSAQGAAFNFLRALVQRRIVINEVYEAMDSLAKLFITYGDGGARNQARSIWLQFVTTYEQSEKRFDQQITFVTRNLEYKHHEGRASVMEAIDFLLGKLDPGHKQKAVLALFIPIMSRFISDDHEKCRSLAGLLLKHIVTEANDESLHTIRKALQNYLGREDRHALQTAGLRVYASFVEADSERAVKDLSLLLASLQTILADAADGNNADWELPYYALQLMSTLCSAYETELTSPKQQALWTIAYQFSAYPHAWVKYAAAALMRVLFENLGSAKVSSSGTLKATSGLTINHIQLCSLIRTYFGTMLRRNVESWLVQSVTENLQSLVGKVGDLTMIQVESNEGQQEDEPADDAEEETGQSDAGTLRSYSLSRIGTIIRRDSPLDAKHAALDILAFIVSQASGEELIPILSDIIRPLNHLTDSSVTQMIQVDQKSRESQEQLKEKSNDIMTVLQKKLPEGAFVSAMHGVQQEVRRRREERRGKRSIAAVANPETSAKYKMRKGMKTRERRKDRNAIERSKRLGY